MFYKISYIYIFMNKISEGAEAEIFMISDKVLKKVRLEKTYRLLEIDLKLRKFRNKREFKILKKLFDSKVNVPEPHELIENKKTGEISFTFEYLHGNILKEVLNEELLKKAFLEIIKMHNSEVIHSDLTTLNMIEVMDEIFLIDFGLSDFSFKTEDRAVDLNLFFNCIKNEHPDLFYLKDELIKMYLNGVESGKKVILRLEKVEQRGRNKGK